MSYVSAFEGRSETLIEQVTTDDDVSLSFEIIDFDPYGNPDVSVTAGSRYATHDIIGATTVRQKLGEEPREIEVSGVCTEPVAQQVNRLHRAELCSLNSDVVAGELIRCQIPSTSTNPLESGGSADMDGGKFLYDFNINLIEVEIL
jgi:hypothetical protein